MNFNSLELFSATRGVEMAVGQETQGKRGTNGSAPGRSVRSTRTLGPFQVRFGS